MGIGRLLRLQDSSVGRQVARALESLRRELEPELVESLKAFRPRRRAIAQTAAALWSQSLTVWKTVSRWLRPGVC